MGLLSKARFEVKLGMIYHHGKKPNLNENLIHHLNQIIKISERAFPRGLVEFDDAKNIQLYEWKDDPAVHMVFDMKDEGMFKLRLNQKIVLFNISSKWWMISIADLHGLIGVVSRTPEFLKLLSETSPKDASRKFRKDNIKLASHLVSHELGHLLGLGHFRCSKDKGSKKGCAMAHGVKNYITFCKGCKKRLSALFDEKNYRAYLEKIKKEEAVY